MYTKIKKDIKKQQYTFDQEVRIKVLIHKQVDSR